MADNTQVIGTTIDNRVKFVEVVNNNLIVDHKLTDAAIASIPTSAIVFIKSENAIYHNGKYYGFTDAERAIIDTNTSILLQKINDRVKTVKVNGAESNNLISITDGGTSNPIEVDLTLNGMTIPITSSDTTLIKNYIDATVDAAKRAAEASGVTSLSVSGIINPLSGATGQVSVNVSGTSSKLGASYTTNIYATSLSADNTIATSIEKLDKEILRRYNDLNESISSNDTDISNLQNIVHTINSNVTSDLSSNKSQQLTHKTNGTSTINLNSTNIVIGGATLSASGMTTTNIGSSIHDALSNVYTRLNNLSNVDNSTLITLQQLEDELRYGTGDNFATTFLDKVGWLINGFDGVNVATAASTNAKDVSLKNAVASMINTATVNLEHVSSITFTSNTNTSNKLDQTISGPSNRTGTVNITANRLIVGSVSGITTSTNIVNTDTISDALKKLQNRASALETTNTNEKDVKIITIKTGSSTLTEVVAATATKNDDSVELVLNADKLKISANITSTTTGDISRNDTVATVIQKILNKIETAQKSADKFAIKTLTVTSIATNETGKIATTITANSREYSGTLNIRGSELVLGKTINGSVPLASTLTISTAIASLDSYISTSFIDVKTAIGTLQTKVNNLESDEHMYWYTI